MTFKGLIGGIIMSNKKSSMTPSSWGAIRTYGAKYSKGPYIEDGDDKRQNKILAELEEKKRLENKKKKRHGKKKRKRFKKNKKQG